MREEMDSLKAPKILIVSSDTGGGHRSAAKAIADGLERFWNSQSFAIRIIRGLEEAHHVTEKLARLYNWLLRNKQHWVKYLYWAVNKIRPETRDFFYKLCFNYIKQLFDKWCPHLIINVHPLTQHFLVRFLKEFNLIDKIPIVTVVTDPCYGFWKGWACEDISLYLVANEDARQQLIDYGIKPEKIKIVGMPVHPKFHEVTEQEAKEVRKTFGLDPNKFTVFVNAGWIGGGNIPKIFRELVRGELNIQAVFLAGKNEELKQEAEKLAKQAKFPVKVIGYSDEIEKLMQAADLMISKLGGLTTFEALACRLPIIADAITPPMPQEAGTAKLIAQKGAGILLRRASDIVPTIKSLLEDSKKYAAMKLATEKLSIQNSTQKIIEEIVSFLPENRSTQVNTKATAS
ncbi:MAG: glycosyl transferase [Pyrinomonadaceae bacterium]|nr:MAG: glycosyl transferase [Pyrinomonadaceae bacterium]